MAVHAFFQAMVAIVVTSTMSVRSAQTVICDIIVAGGSLSSTAAALTAAEVSPELVTCYLDITDWPGGQMTASATSAIDFGSNWQNFPVNVPGAFGDLLLSKRFGNSSFNPGGCTVSKKCFPPAWAVEWFVDAMANLTNLKPYLNTAIIGATRDNSTGRVVGLRAVQRTPTAAHPSGWDRVQSAALPDWYSSTDSAFFTKTVLDFVLGSPSGAIIEGTEFGDVLMTAGLPTVQGMELPVEDTPTSYDDHCGQAATVCFWTSWDTTLAPSPDPTPYGSDVGYPLPIDLIHQANLDHAFTWRRSIAVDPSDSATPKQGDLFLINEQAGNDLLNGQVFLPLADAQAQIAAGAWTGGINLTALAMAEERSFAYYWTLRNATAVVYPAMLPYMVLNKSAAGTDTGLAKMPYLRESRRASRGIQRFRLCHDFAAAKDPGAGGPGCYQPGAKDGTPASGSSSGPLTGLGFKWVDDVGIGDYGFDIHHFNRDFCTYPAYLNYTPDPGPSSPYFLPFRAHTVEGAPNLLVSGKNMAQTFLANAVTRLHPTEWVSGTAAGAAAALMTSKGWSTLDVYTNKAVLQGFLNSTKLRSPLDWTGVK